MGAPTEQVSYPTMSDPEQLRDRFERLRPFLPVAANDALLALRYAAEDPEGSVAKSRRVTEALLKEIVPADVKERELLTIEQMKSRVRLPRREAAFVGLVQMLGNEGAHHRDTRLSPADARRVLDALGGLVDWYLHVHRRQPRPRRTRWGLVVAAAGVLGVGAAGVVAVLMLLIQGEPALAPVSVATSAPAPQPDSVVSVAEPLPVYVTAAPLAVAVPLWSRPTLSGEPPPAENEGPAAPVKRCEGPISEWHAQAITGGWALASATCGGDTMEGWFDVAAVRGAGGTVSQWPRPSTDHRWSRGVEKADALLADGQWGEAERAYEPLLADAPYESVLYRSRGLARLRNDDARAAVDDLAACLVLEPATARGPCHLYLGEALKALGDPGGDQMLSDAVAYNPDLAPDVAALRAGPAQELTRLPYLGPKGLPLLDEPVRAGVARRLRDGAPGASKHELCRLHGGEAFEVRNRRGASLYVRTQCDGKVQFGYLPAELDGHALVPE